MEIELTYLASSHDNHITDNEERMFQHLLLCHSVRERSRYARQRKWVDLFGGLFKSIRKDIKSVNK